MNVKFGDCPCTVAEEDWELTGLAEYLEDDEGTAMVEYQCQTCETRQTTEAPLKKI